jgi:hypothetical protein
MKTLPSYQEATKEGKPKGPWHSPLMPAKKIALMVA